MNFQFQILYEKNPFMDSFSVFTRILFIEKDYFNETVI